MSVEPQNLGTQGTYARSGESASLLATSSNKFDYVGGGVAAGPGADISIVLSKGQDAGGYSVNSTVNSTVYLGNVSRQDVTRQADLINPITGILYSKELNAINVPTLNPDKLDCKGTWSTCDFTTGLQTYSVSILPNSLGEQCKYNTGDVQFCSVSFFNKIVSWIVKKMTTKNLLSLVFIVLVLWIFISSAFLLRDLYGSGSR